LKKRNLKALCCSIWTISSESPLLIKIFLPYNWHLQGKKVWNCWMERLRELNISFKFKPRYSFIWMHLHFICLQLAFSPFIQPYRERSSDRKSLALSRIFSAPWKHQFLFSSHIHIYLLDTNSFRLNLL